MKKKIKNKDLTQKININQTVIKKLIPKKEYFLFLNDLIDYDVITQ